MRLLPRIAALLLPAGLVACAETAEVVPDAAPIPARIEIGFSGYVTPVLNEAGQGEIAVLREGAEEPVVVPFSNARAADFALAPGRYEVTRIGALGCRGMRFEVPEDAAARALGTLRGDVIRTDFYVALLAGRPATETEVAQLGAAAGVAPERIDARPISVAEQAPCFVNRQGPGETWRDRPLGEQILLGIGFAAFCAAAVAAGGFCAW